MGVRVLKFVRFQNLKNMLYVEIYFYVILNVAPYPVSDQAFGNSDPILRQKIFSQSTSVHNVLILGKLGKEI
jgi:hypothetical protein